MPKDAERNDLLKAYENLRVADVRDGMDTVGLLHTGSMSPQIRPLWRTHVVGIAKTARYVPYDGPMPAGTGDALWKWGGEYYGKICPDAWADGLQEGDFVVIDLSGMNIGMLGSHNSLGGIKRGARGYITNGGVRDTDEMIMQKIPFWSVMCSQARRWGRIRFESKDVPVNVGGVTVNPGDMVVADGDGVIVVPRSVALDVASYANAERKRDIAGRRRLYEELGMPIDETVIDEDEAGS
jgi:regulator of RNase E activity RraA